MMTSLIRQARLRGPHPGVAPKDRVAHVMRARLRLFSLVAAASLLLFALVSGAVWLVRNVEPDVIVRHTPQSHVLPPTTIQDVVHDVAFTVAIVLYLYILGVVGEIIRRRALPNGVGRKQLLVHAAQKSVSIAFATVVFDAVQAVVFPHTQLAGGLVTVFMNVYGQVTYIVIALSQRHTATDADAYSRSSRQVTRTTSHYSPGIVQAMGLDDEELALEIARHKELLQLLKDEQETRRTGNATVHRNAR